MNGYLKAVILTAAVTAIFCAQAWAVPIDNLFSDHRAMRVGDILTIIIVESAKAGSESKTNTSKGSEIGFKASSIKMLPQQQLGLSNGATYDGKGATSRSGSLSATVTARVIEVQENGNLLIEGGKTVEINQEKEIIKISGIVRPQDIQKNNIVYSSSIADAEITYSGNGTVNTAARPGFVSRIFNWLF